MCNKKNNFNINNYQLIIKTNNNNNTNRNNA